MNVEEDTNPNPIFYLECSDHDYILKSGNFLAYPIKDVIMEAIHRDEGIAEHFVLEAVVKTYGRQAQYKNYLSRDQVLRVFQPEGLISEWLKRGFEELHKELDDNDQDPD